MFCDLPANQCGLLANVAEICWQPNTHQYALSVIAFGQVKKESENAVIQKYYLN